MRQRVWGIAVAFALLGMTVPLAAQGSLPYLTARENVALCAALAGVSDPQTRATTLLSEVSLGERATHRPNQLSGGERQRVGVACALAGDPAVVLADEITGELDSATADRLVTLVIRLGRQARAAVLLVTHNPAVAMRADRVLRIEDGVLTPLLEVDRWR
ncbi:MAG TPA: ATP-binding cassette domain-containing protein [Chloroflexota bacterium]|nr:ATP-binding cassette domain-containing protein [Chloroflexota bacterium]